MAKAETEKSIFVPAITKGHLKINVLGTNPLICNRMSQKTWHQLALPPRKKNSAERQSTLKHLPLEEFRDSPYRLSSPTAPTLIALMSSAFKGAMATAALDLPGTKKAQIGRLVYVEGDYTAIYGKPQIFSSIVRSADINRTPDVRTRAIIPEWAAVVEISFVTPILNDHSIVNLMAAAGVTAGVGDWRPEKGKGDYGQFRIVVADDPDFQRILRQGRAVQQEAMANPEPYDDETAELLEWFDEEVRRRGFGLPTEVEEVEEEEEESEDGVAVNA